MKHTILVRSFYQRNTVTVARELIGKLLVREIDGTHLIGRIVETEAYTSDDPACHAYVGKTERTTALFGAVGHAYIYLSYGIHHCMNIVARPPELAAGGVLIRALEPVEGIEQMKKIRNVSNLRTLTNGPGKLSHALGITKLFYGADLTKVGALYVIDPHDASISIVSAPRVGISKAQDRLWRFYADNNEYVSAK